MSIERPDVTFIHLTDTHVGTADDTHLHSDTTATLQQVIDRIAAITPPPAFVIASGDLTNRGDAASFRRLKAMLDSLDLPIVYALGNHDTRPGFYEGFDIATSDPQAPYDHDMVLAGLHIITLDTSEPGAIGGTITSEQFDWLAAALDRHSELPKLIVAHHPPALGDSPDVTHWRTIHFPQSQRLAAMLKRRPVLAILSGHIHHDRVSIWHGIPVFVGTGLHAATDILVTDRLSMVRGASFGLATVRRSGITLVTIPLPSDRAELATYPYALLLERARPAAAE